MATYEFTLESKDVEGFKLKGTYYLEPRPEEQDKAIRGSMFSGESLSREELAELERLWVKLYPSKPIFVGVDTLTGPIVDHPSSFLVEPPYRGLSDADVYGLTSAPDTEFFRLDRQNGNWEHLPGFVEPRS